MSTPFWANLSDLEIEFRRLDIPFMNPGFYDHPKFIAQEKGGNLTLQHYARYVQLRIYDANYLSRAVREIPIMVEKFQSALKRNGRLGACVDVANPLSRILEREGYWNYVALGGLEISPTPPAGRGPVYFYGVDTQNPKVAGGHAWVVAPPYRVVDISVRLQPYTAAEKQFVPDIVMATTGQEFTAESDDILSPSVRQVLRSRGIPRNMSLQAVNPGLPKMLNTFPAVSIVADQAELHYMTTHLSASDGPLEKITNMKYDGRFAIDVYHDEILPALREQRTTA